MTETKWTDLQTWRCKSETLIMAHITSSCLLHAVFLSSLLKATLQSTTQGTAPSTDLRQEDDQSLGHGTAVTSFNSFNETNQQSATTSSITLDSTTNYNFLLHIAAPTTISSIEQPKYNTTTASETSATTSTVQSIVHKSTANVAAATLGSNATGSPVQVGFRNATVPPGEEETNTSTAATGTASTEETGTTSTKGPGAASSTEGSGATTSTTEGTVEGSPTEGGGAGASPKEDKAEWSGGERHEQHSMYLEDYCTCDLTGLACDVGCCCDPDCTAEDRRAFRGCTATPRTLAADPRYCYQRWVGVSHNTEFTVEERARTLFCIHTDNLPERTVFRTVKVARNIPAYNTLRGQRQDVPKVRSPSDPPGESTPRHPEHYRQGSRVWGVDQRGRLFPLGVPTSLFSSSCDSERKLSYLDDTRTSCTRRIPPHPRHPSLCSSHPAFNVRRLVPFLVVAHPGRLLKPPPAADTSTTTADTSTSTAKPDVTEETQTTTLNTTHITIALTTTNATTVEPNTTLGDSNLTSSIPIASNTTHATISALAQSVVINASANTSHVTLEANSTAFVSPTNNVTTYQPNTTVADSITTTVTKVSDSSTSSINATLDDRHGLVANLYLNSTKRGNATVNNQNISQNITNFTEKPTQFQGLDSSVELTWFLSEDDLLINATHLIKVQLELCKDGVAGDNCSAVDSGDTLAESNCSEVVTSVTYVITHGGGNGIKSVVAKIRLETLSDPVLESPEETPEDQTVPHDSLAGRSPAGYVRQNYAVVYRWAKDNGGVPGDDEMFERSGRPGYRRGKRLLLGALVRNVTNGGDVKEAIAHDTHPSRGLSVPRAGVGGVCEGRSLVTFGDNIHSVCQLLVTEDDILNNCNELRARVKDVLLGSILNDTGVELRVASYGDSSVMQPAEWVPLLRGVESMKSSTELNMFLSERGRCTELVLSFRLEVAFALQGSLAHPQAKVIGAVLTTGVPQLSPPTGCWGPRCKNSLPPCSVTEEKAAANNSTHTSIRPNCSSGTQRVKVQRRTVAIELVSSVEFIDVTEPSEPLFPDPPRLDVKLPYDFFYPFLPSAGAGLSRGSSSCCTVLGVLMLLSVFGSCCL